MIGVKNKFLIRFFLSLSKSSHEVVCRSRGATFYCYLLFDWGRG